MKRNSRSRNLLVFSFIVIAAGALVPLACANGDNITGDDASGGSGGAVSEAGSDVTKEAAKEASSGGTGGTSHEGGTDAAADVKKESAAGSGGSGGSPLHVMEEREGEEGQCKEGQVWLFGSCFP